MHINVLTNCGMRIKSIHKKGSKLLMDNKRGLFLTNILSKLYEKVLDLLTTEKVKINEHQCGGQKGVVQYTT